MTDLTTGIPSVHYRGYLIDICEFRDGYTYAAEDYDGPEDERCGWAVDIDAAKEDIDELEGPRMEIPGHLMQRIHGHMSDLDVLPGTNIGPLIDTIEEYGKYVADALESQS